MTDKAYIVANKQQELEVLKKMEQDRLLWLEGQKPTDWIPSKNVYFDFPYVLIYDGGGNIIVREIEELENETIVYDGRKEEKKYKVTQEFMNELIEWRDQRNLDTVNGGFYATFRGQDFRALPRIVSGWHLEDTEPIERNNRLIAIIKWLNGEDVFEVEETHRFIVRSDNPDEDGDYLYVEVLKSLTSTSYSLLDATRFNTLEEAQEWANSHQVVVEIDENGNEVE